MSFPSAPVFEISALEVSCLGHSFGAAVIRAFGESLALQTKGRAPGQNKAGQSVGLASRSPTLLFSSFSVKKRPRNRGVLVEPRHARRPVAEEKHRLVKTGKEAFMAVVRHTVGKSSSRALH